MSIARTWHEYYEKYGKYPDNIDQGFFAVSAEWLEANSDQTVLEYIRCCLDYRRVSKVFEETRDIEYHYNHRITLGIGAYENKRRTLMSFISEYSDDIPELVDTWKKLLEQTTQIEVIEAERYNKTMSHQIPFKDRLRQRIAERDNWTCHYCGIVTYLCHELVDRKLWTTVDHKVCKSSGGGDDDGNLVCCCSSCNSKKGIKSYEKFLSELLGE